MMKNILYSLNNLPANNNLTFFWSGGSFLGILMTLQILTGIILSVLFTPTIFNFWNLIFITDESLMIIIFRLLHSNGASMLFMLIFFHMGRGIFFNSQKKIKMMWMSGMLLYVLLMTAAFLGYVLPWGQMSLWGGTVITNLFGVISSNLVILMWGDFSVCAPAMSLFFTLHFLVPLILFVFLMLHVILLHEQGSSSMIFNSNKKKMFNYFYIKDGYNNSMIFFFFFFFFLNPWLLGDPENFIQSNNISSPIHIMPEWYFLWAYAILRAIPSKLGGVLALFSAVLILFFIIFKNNKNKDSSKLNKINKILLVNIFFFLTWLGSCPVEMPYILLSQVFSILYFLIILIILC